MKHRLSFAVLACAAILRTTTASSQNPLGETPEDPLAALGTSFTYQGRLTDGGSPASGSVDLQLALFDAATTPPGVQVGVTLVKDDVAVSQGLFTVELDFGASVFTGQALWIEIGARPGASSGAFTALYPRQPLRSAPFAHYARAGVATDVQCSGCVGSADLTVAAVGVDRLAAGAASSGQVLTATGTSTMAWQTPTGPTGSGSAGQVAFWTGAGSIGGSSGMVWDSVNGRLGLGTATPTDQLQLTGNLSLPSTTSAPVGVLELGGSPFMHAFGTRNTFLGSNAGNLTMGGGLGQGVHNTGVGHTALSNNTTGAYNTAVGSSAMVSNLSGDHNTAVGDGCLEQNTKGAYNTALGSGALGDNRVAGMNTAVGASALRWQSYDNGGTTWSTHNTAVGYCALRYNQPTSETNGSNNVAVGFSALMDNTVGMDNVAVGDESLSNNTAAGRNTAVGRYALFFQGYDNGGVEWNADNTAIGFYALYMNQPTSTTVGRRNTAVGGASGDSYTGTGNTFLGYDADATVDLLSNATAIGLSARVNASNKVRIGNSSVSVIEGQVAYSWPSDLRLKEDVRALSLGLGFIARLRPVEFTMKGGNGRTDLGFIAQDIEALLGDGYNLLTIGEDGDRMLGLRATDLIAPLVKAVQEQQAEIGAKAEEISSLRAEVSAQRDLLDDLARRLAALEGRGGQS